MSRIYDNLLNFIATHAPKGRVESLIADLDAMQAEAATARGRTLDEVWRHVNADQGEHFASGELAEHLAKLRTTPANPRLSRLEREVARTSLLAVRAEAAWDRETTSGDAYDGYIAARNAQVSACRTMREHLIDGKGGAK